MQVRFDALDPAARHRWITATVAPRPVALVTSQATGGPVNAAPFSCFNYMGEDPPAVYLGIETVYAPPSHRAGEMKDTLRNILAVGAFVVHIVDAPMLERAVACATDFPATVSEPEVVGFALTPSTEVAVPRIPEAPVALECRLHTRFDLSARRAVVVGQIVLVHVREDLVDPASGRIDQARYRPVARIGGPTYVLSTDRVTVPVAPYTSGA